jgi:ubiquinone/menaquinone biosynthesis C-methylase UbiE
LEAFKESKLTPHHRGSDSGCIKGTKKNRDKETGYRKWKQWAKILPKQPCRSTSSRIRGGKNQLSLTSLSRASRSSFFARKTSFIRHKPKFRVGGGSTSSRKNYQKDTLGKKITVEGAFDTFVETYDNVMSKSMTMSAAMLIQNLQIPENPTALDIGCGTGLSTFELMKKTHGRGKFHGIDISQKMIDLVKTKAAKLGYSNVKFTKGDAERLEFPASSFDIVISNQVFHFLLNKQKALDEIFRVLKPTGQAALVFFGESTGKEIEEIYNGIKTRHPEYGLPESLRLISLKETQELFDKAGFKRTKILPVQLTDYADPSGYTLYIDAPSNLWRINVTTELGEVMAKEMRKEMMKARTDKGFKVTIYGILAYAHKT